MVAERIDLVRAHHVPLTAAGCNTRLYRISESAMPGHIPECGQDGGMLPLGEHNTDSCASVPSTFKTAALGADLLVGRDHLHLHCYREAERVLEIRGDVAGQSGKIRW